MNRHMNIKIKTYYCRHILFINNCLQSKYIPIYRKPYRFNRLRNNSDIVSGGDENVIINNQNNSDNDSPGPGIGDDNLPCMV